MCLAALKEDLPLAASLSDEARLYYQQGEYAEAERFYRRSLAIREKALGPDHPDVATSLDNLAELYQAQGKYAEAEPLLQRSLAIRKGATNRLGAKPPENHLTAQGFQEFFRAEGLENDPDIQVEAKEPWKRIRFEGEVEGNFLTATLLSRHLL